MMRKLSQSVKAISVAILALLAVGGVTKSKKAVKQDLAFLNQVGVTILPDNTLTSASQPSRPSCHTSCT